MSTTCVKIYWLEMFKVKAFYVLYLSLEDSLEQGDLVGLAEARKLGGGRPAAINENLANIAIVRFEMLCNVSIDS